MVVGMTYTSCKEEKKPEKDPQIVEAQAILKQIKADYAAGNYHVVLDSIRSLRKKCPNAAVERTLCIKYYQDASLKISQQELEEADSAVQIAQRYHDSLQADIRRRYPDGNAPESKLDALTKARLKLDSLKVRFETLCGQVRYIHKRQNERPR